MLNTNKNKTTKIKLKIPIASDDADLQELSLVFLGNAQLNGYFERQYDDFSHS